MKQRRENKLPKRFKEDKPQFKSYNSNEKTYFDKGERSGYDKRDSFRGDKPSRGKRFTNNKFEGEDRNSGGYNNTKGKYEKKYAEDKPFGRYKGNPPYSSRETRNDDRPRYNSSRRRENTGKGEYSGYKRRNESAGNSEYSTYKRKNDKPAYNERSKYNDKPAYNDRPKYNEKREKAKFDERVNNNQEQSNYNESANATQDDNRPILIFGRNSVRETLKSERSIDKIFILDTGAQDGSLRELMNLAKEKKIVIINTAKQKLDDMTIGLGFNNKPANHQGIIAQMSATQYVEIDDILQKAKDKNELPFIIIINEMNDPYNLGSIIRTASCAGVHGVIIPKRRSVGITSAVAKASSGALMHMDIARVSNINNAIETLKKNNVWIAGADMEGTSIYKSNLKGAMAVVIGNEGEGLSSLVKKNCDLLLSIPMKGEIGSLNASNAASIIMYEKVRQEISNVAIDS